MNREEFNELASRVFGDKIRVCLIPLEAANKLLEKTSPHTEPLSQEEVEAYGEQAFVVGGKCPVCEQILLTYFRWGIVHGEGGCSHCNKTSFRYYHRVRDGMYPIMSYTLCGFTVEEEEKQDD